MKRRFVIPAAVAMALHALLLFGFRRSHGLPPPPPPADRTCTAPIDFRVSEVPPDADTAAAVAPRGSPDARPELPEPPPSTLPHSFTMPPAEPHPGPIHSASLITCGPMGDPNDKGEWNCLGPIGYKLLDNPPRTRSQVAPVYPYDAAHDGRTGSVWVEFTVDETGGVLNPRVSRSTDPVFEAPTLRAVAKWRFEPGRRSGHVVRFRMALPVVFALTP